MNAVLDFVLSPAGLAAYAAFWAFKLTLGVWLLRRAMTMIPARVRVRMRSAGRRRGLLKVRRARMAPVAAVLDPKGPGTQPGSLPLVAGE